MNCSDVQVWLQGRLDGEPVAERAPLEAHLAGCPACRELLAAAERLTTGLRLRQPPAPPAELTERIVGRLRAGARRARRLAVGLALAASLLVAVGLVARGRRPPVAPPGQVAVRRELPPSL